MMKSKSTRRVRTKHAPREPHDERQSDAERRRHGAPEDHIEPVSDGVIKDDLDELDTDRYERTDDEER